MLLKIVAGFLIIIILSLISVSLYFTHKFLYFKNIDDRTPEDLGLEYDDVVFQSDELNVSGWYIPSNVSVKENITVLLLHGFTRSKAANLERTEFLVDNGYDVFTFDFRGHGETRGRTTIGEKEYKEILGAVDYLKERNDNDIYGIGYSMGASSLIIAAAKNDSIEKVVSDSSFANFEKSLDNNIEKTLPFSFVFKSFVRLSLNIYDIKVDRTNPIDVVDEISPRPIFIIHGREDGLLKLKNARSLYEKAEEPKEMWLVEDANHIGSHVVKEEEYWKRILNFFKE